MSRSHAHRSRRPAAASVSAPGAVSSRLLAGLTAAALSAACTSSAHAQTLATDEREPIQSIRESPYSIDLLSPTGQPLPTYQGGGRYYVLGDAGDRYTVRVTNPTPHRVEAVVSIDGLDAIDGEPADYTSKRGYVVPARGELRVDGFRVSERAVAAFRFSSVANSYAGRKGRARNVGVVGVAIFEETARHPQVRAERDRDWRRVPPRSRSSRRAPAGPPPRAGSAPRADAEAPADESAAPRGEAQASRAPRRSHGGAAEGRCCGHDGGRHGRHRPGLGTEFGERRHSRVTFTRFVRAHPERPTAVAELRYNDAPGLAALGIHVRPQPDRHEVWTRETARPFPFARPPGHH